MLLSRRSSAFLIAFGVWSWVIWPTFLRNIAHDSRSFTHSQVHAFFVVHALLTGASLAFGTAIGVLGVRGWRAARSGRQRPGPSRADGPQQGLDRVGGG